MAQVHRSLRLVDATEPSPLPVSPPTNLPVQLTRFVGRAREQAELRELLASRRLVTVAGPGGSGKTRLALEVAAGLGGEYPAGVYLAELATLGQDGLAVASVARAIGVQDEPGQLVLETVKAAIGERRMLLVIDNCEHLLEDAARVAEGLMGACPNLRLLATSREELGLPGEAVYRLPPLETVASGQVASVEALATVDAVRLFVDRATAALPSFKLTAENADAVAAICRRVDGLPLAIELAATRVTVLSPRQLADRLANALQLLTQGHRLAAARQRALRATIDWSYGLLNERERCLFRRLAVFAGGWTIEAAERVCADEPIGRERTLDLLGQLIAKSLVEAHPGDDGYRYSMLETLRQYAQERLEESGEGATVRMAHLRYCVELAEAGQVALQGADQIVWSRRLAADLDNFRAAMGWAAGQSAGQVRLGLRIAAALTVFCIQEGLAREGTAWLRMLIDAYAGPPCAELVKGLGSLGSLATTSGELPIAMAALDRMLALEPEIDDRAAWDWSVAQGAFPLVLAGRLAEAEALAERCVEAFERRRWPWNLAAVLIVRGLAAGLRGDPAAGVRHLERGLEVAEELQDRFVTGNCLVVLGRLALYQGNAKQAASYFDQGLARTAEIPRSGISLALRTARGQVALRQGDLELAERMFREALQVATPAGSREFIGAGLIGLAGVLRARRRPAAAARLLAAGMAIRAALGIYNPPQEQAQAEALRETIEAELGAEAFAAASAAGAALATTAAAEEALALVAPGASVREARPTVPPPTAAAGAALSAREFEVVALLAKGLGNREIAAALVISQGTAKRHVENILTKLGFESRWQVAAWAEANGLAQTD
ncbi:MAG TPA: LuxR C-terminal-related transcriptional regulator [Chloroflexota bacterium]|nr:LuxR C-terminal-related transcriptional regulator [Chloroflexota bacterium]